MLERLAQEYRKTGDRLPKLMPCGGSRRPSQCPDIQAAYARQQSLQALLRTDQNKIGVLFPLSGPAPEPAHARYRGLNWPWPPSKSVTRLAVIYGGP